LTRVEKLRLSPENCRINQEREDVLLIPHGDPYSELFQVLEEVAFQLISLDPAGVRPFTCASRKREI
jgi:hypothetical protein